MSDFSIWQDRALEPRVTKESKDGCGGGRKGFKHELSETDTFS